MRRVPRVGRAKVGKVVTIMSDGLSLLSDDELTRLRTRYEQIIRLGSIEQRLGASGCLETIDVERERRLSSPAGGKPD